MIYNIGGGGSNYSVLWYDLTSNGNWNPIDLVNSNFKNWYYRMAHLVHDQIVYFGSNNSKTIYVMEKEEQSQVLKTVKQD